MIQLFYMHKVYIESGEKRTFAGVIEWPGWCRSGRDEEGALQALVTYGPRYAEVVQLANLGFQAPSSVSALVVVERLSGTKTTDFGAPDRAPAADARQLDEADLRRFQALVIACWQKFDQMVKAAKGRALRKGSRGGGRELEAILSHVIEAEMAYLERVGRRLRSEPITATPGGVRMSLIQEREAVLSALTAATDGEWPARGPRGGSRWSARYFVRRLAWHVLDHAWEIEDRLEPS